MEKEKNKKEEKENTKTIKVSDFIGEKATYDNDGQIIFGVEKDGGHQRIADVRGWGGIQGLFRNRDGRIRMDEAMAFQDELGKWIVDAINEKLEREKQNDNI